MIAKVYRAYKAGGFKEINKKIISKFYTRYYMYTIKLEPKIIEQVKKYPQFRFVPLDTEIFQKICKEFPEEISQSKYDILKDRLREESMDKSFIVQDDQQNIYGFYSLNIGDEIDIDSEFIIPANNEYMYLFDAYTFISRRGKKAQHFALASRLKIGYEMGYKYASTIVKDGNVPSEKSVMDSGFQRSKIIEYYHILGFKRNHIRNI